MSVEAEGGQCPVCECWASDHEPGVSATKIDGVWYHPLCAQAAQLEMAPECDGDELGEVTP